MMLKKLPATKKITQQNIYYLQMVKICSKHINNKSRLDSQLQTLKFNNLVLFVLHTKID